MGSKSNRHHFYNSGFSFAPSTHSKYSCHHTIYGDTLPHMGFTLRIFELFLFPNSFRKIDCSSAMTCHCIFFLSWIIAFYNITWAWRGDGFYTPQNRIFSYEAIKNVFKKFNWFAAVVFMLLPICILSVLLHQEKRFYHPIVFFI